MPVNNLVDGTAHLATIHYPLQWHRTTMPFPARAYVQWNCKLIPYSCVKALLQKAVSLSQRNLCCEPCLNIASSWWTMFVESCLANYFQKEKHDRSQSVRVKKCKHQNARCPFLTCAISCSPLAFPFPSELVLGLRTGIFCISLGLT